MQDSPMAIFYVACAFFFGAILGSFFNVCIHRWPRGQSVNNPKRSYCPSCDDAIPFSDNIPLLSWLLLRGRCRGCGAPIAFRYFAVELLTAVVFALIVYFWPWQQALALLFFASVCIVATVVDLEHFIIPDEVTVYAIPFGLAASALVPSLHDKALWWDGLLSGATGAAVGFAVLWFVVQLGKWLFGRKRFDFPDESDWQVAENDGEIELRIGGELYLWSELFSRPSDRVLITCTDLTVDSTEQEGVGRVDLAWDHVVLYGTEGDELRRLDLAKVDRIDGRASGVIIPREAMGFGDVKFMALVGCFVGWSGVIFVLAVGSILGTLGALVAALVGRSELSARIPFGPYLVAGAWIWLTMGPALLDKYLSFLRFEPHL